MRVLLDVGAHTGQTLDVALNPDFGFDRIFCFEPATSCQRVLRRFRDRRVVVLPFGLSNDNRRVELVGAGLLGASIYRDKSFIDALAARRVELVALRRASTWLSTNTLPGDEILIKLNCEGSECDILDDILQDPVHLRVKGIYVDFDVRKVPSMVAREAETTRRMEAAKVNFVRPEDISAPTGMSRFEAWLRQAVPVRSSRFVTSARYRLRLYRPLYIQIREYARLLLPPRAFSWLARRVGINRGRRHSFRVSTAMVCQASSREQLHAPGQVEH